MHADDISPTGISQQGPNSLGQAIVQAPEDAIIGKDLEGIIQTWNRSAERIFGYSAHEVIGRSITLLIPPDRLPEEQEILAQLRRGERVDHYETVRVRKDGSRVAISLTISPIKDGTGRVIGASKVARDITEQKEAERAQAYLAAIIDSADDAIIGKDLDGIIQSWNKSATRIFGYTPAEVIGKPVTLLLPAERLDEEPQILRSIRNGERVDHFETVRVRKDGRQIPVSLTISPVNDRQGNVIGASKIARDITDQKRLAQLELNEARTKARAFEQLQAIMAAVPAAILIAEDAHCRNVRANRAGQELMAAFNGGTRPATSMEERTPGGLPAELSHLRQAAHGVALPNWEIKAQLADGREHHFLGNAVPLLDEQGQVWGAVAVLVDLTERMRAEAGLKEADRRKDEFLAMLAHELRNPLMPIKTALEIIHKGLGDERRRDWALQVIDRQLVQLTRIIDDLLEIGRIANGKIALKRESTSLRAIVSQALETTRPLMNTVRHVLDVKLPVQEIQLHADRGRVAQALSNLLANAAKFTAPGGIISMSASREGEAVEIRIRDSGRGMDKELLPQVFDMFVQGSTDLARTDGGLGIGLSIVRRIVELHGGTVSAYSEGKDKGSEFVLRLPLALDAPVEENRPEVPAPSPGKSRRVLIVDDNHDVTDSIAELFRMSGRCGSTTKETACSIRSRTSGRTP